MPRAQHLLFVFSAPLPVPSQAEGLCVGIPEPAKPCQTLPKRAITPKLQIEPSCQYGSHPRHSPPSRPPSRPSRARLSLPKSIAVCLPKRATKTHTAPHRATSPPQNCQTNPPQILMFYLSMFYAPFPQLPSPHTIPLFPARAVRAGQTHGMEHPRSVDVGVFIVNWTTRTKG